MKKTSIALTLLPLLSLTNAFGQFLVKDTYFETTGVSNQGVVVGYETWAGPYSFWMADSAVSASTLVIGGTAPGNGVGGQARFSVDGNKVSGTSIGANGAELSLYDVSTNQWTPLGSLGFSVDNNVSAGYAISGDGSTVVGNAWADTAGGLAFTHAIACSQSGAVSNLGSLYAGKSTRANAVSGDGSVVVGWQDFNGPWKSAVWRKNPAGGYFPNTYLLLDSTKSATDEFNQLGECSAVSLDGNWIGGYGDYANNGEPWIWSKATGVISLGMLGTGLTGYVLGINQDGTVVVGRFRGGPFDPELPFIWTPATGIQNLNEYVNNTLGYSTAEMRISSANCMSPDGKYLAGYGMDTVSSQFFTFRLHRVPATSISGLATPSLKVYPNPATDFIAIEGEGASAVRITNLAGQEIAAITLQENERLDISRYPAGIYFLQMHTHGQRITQKFIKK